MEIGLKTIYGFINIDHHGNNEGSIKCNKEYRSWFNKKEIIKIIRDTHDGLVMKNSEGETIAIIPGKGFLDLIHEDQKESDCFPVSLEDVSDYKVAIRSNSDGCFFSAHKSGKITCDKLDSYLSEHFQIFINYTFLEHGENIHVLRLTRC